jgi:hypothetical protein
MPKPKRRSPVVAENPPLLPGALGSVERAMGMFRATPRSDRPVVEWIASLAFVCALTRCDDVKAYSFALVVILIHIAWSEIKDFRKRRDSARSGPE